VGDLRRRIFRSPAPAALPRTARLCVTPCRPSGSALTPRKRGYSHASNSKCARYALCLALCLAGASAPAIIGIVSGTRLVTMIQKDAPDLIPFTQKIKAADISGCGRRAEGACRHQSARPTSTLMGFSLRKIGGLPRRSPSTRRRRLRADHRAPANISASSMSTMGRPAEAASSSRSLTKLCPQGSGAEDLEKLLARRRRSQLNACGWRVRVPACLRAGVCWSSFSCHRGFGIRAIMPARPGYMQKSGVAGAAAAGRHRASARRRAR